VYVCEREKEREREGGERIVEPGENPQQCLYSTINGFYTLSAEDMTNPGNVETLERSTYA
jgi:hypothetical protein